MHTVDAHVAGFEVGREIALARSNVDERSNADVARLSTGTLGVEQRDDVVGTAEIVVSANAASQSHSSVHRRTHQNHFARAVARSVEVLRQTVFANL